VNKLVFSHLNAKQRKYILILHFFINNTKYLKGKCIMEKMQFDIRFEELMREHQINEGKKWDAVKKFGKGALAAGVIATASYTAAEKAVGERFGKNFWNAYTQEVKDSAKLKMLNDKLVSMGLPRERTVAKATVALEQAIKDENDRTQGKK
jgi:hypothetical protein